MLHRYLFKNRSIYASAAMIAMFVISGLAHGGGVLFVDDDAPPGGDGTSGDTAYRFLGDALTDASGGGIAEIHVAQGIYKPDQDEANPIGSSDRGRCDRTAIVERVRAASAGRMYLRTEIACGGLLQ